MKSILLVEDDSLLLEIVSNSLRLADPTYSVQAVDSGRRALGLLESQPFDLLVTDLSMPDLDGLALLSAVGQLQPQIPVIVITGRVTAGLEPLVRSLGAKMFIKKPFDLDVLLVSVERFLMKVEDPAENRIRDFGLQSFLQMMEIDGKTSLVRVAATVEKIEGQLRFVAGKLVNASTAAQVGDEAVLEMLRWREPEIRISSMASPVISNVRSSLTSLLLRSCQAQDEFSHVDLRSSELSRN